MSDQSRVAYWDNYQRQMKLEAQRQSRQSALDLAAQDRERKTQGCVSCQGNSMLHQQTKSFYTNRAPTNPKPATKDVNDPRHPKHWGRATWACLEALTAGYSYERSTASAEERQAMLELLRGLSKLLVFRCAKCQEHLDHHLRTDIPTAASPVLATKVSLQKWLARMQQTVPKDDHESSEDPVDNGSISNNRITSPRTPRKVAFSSQPEVITPRSPERSPVRSAMTPSQTNSNPSPRSALRHGETWSRIVNTAPPQNEVRERENPIYEPPPSAPAYRSRLGTGSSPSRSPATGRYGGLQTSFQPSNSSVRLPSPARTGFLRPSSAAAPSYSANSVTAVAAARYSDSVVANPLTRPNRFAKTLSAARGQYD